MKSHLTKIITIMKQKELLKQIAVMTAYAAGNEVEYRELPNGEWQSIEYPAWDWINNNYRVKE